MLKNGFIRLLGASVDSSGTNKDRLSSFSNRGCWVNSFAPGRQVLSNWSPTLAPPNGAVTLYEGGNYATWSGTSQAAAMVSGAAAVLWSMAPDKAAADIVTLLQQTSDSVIGLQCADEVNGRKRGRINLSAAMAQVAQPKCSSTPPVESNRPQAPGNFSVQ